MHLLKKGDDKYSVVNACMALISHVLNACQQHSLADCMRNGPILPTICFHDVIFEEFVDCSVMEKDNFADVQLDKTVFSEESLY